VKRLILLLLLPLFGTIDVQAELVDSLGRPLTVSIDTGSPYPYPHYSLRDGSVEIRRIAKPIRHRRDASRLRRFCDGVLGGLNPPTTVKPFYKDQPVKGIAWDGEPSFDGLRFFSDRGRVPDDSKVRISLWHGHGADYSHAGGLL